MHSRELLWLMSSVQGWGGCSRVSLRAGISYLLLSPHCPEELDLELDPHLLPDPSPTRGDPPSTVHVRATHVKTMLFV